LLHLILSLDYEIFGSGSGDVRRDMIEPTYRLLALCGRYGAKLSIMLEVGEYWAIKKAEEAGSLHLDYSPSQQIEKQIQYAVGCGHDVQLHLHPWWIGATFEDNKWQLSRQHIRISDLPNGIGAENDIFSIVGALCEGKRTLETIIRPVCPDYVCLVYRAALFFGQPSTELIVGMKQAGFVADSSVVKGMYETKPVLTDYRQAQSAMGYWWTSAEDISQPGPKGEQVIEFPVCSRLRPYVCNLKWRKLHATLRMVWVARTNTHDHRLREAAGSVEPPGKILKKLFTLQPVKYDFCKFTASDMIRRLRRLIKRDQNLGDDFGTPVVMLGHSKAFWNDQNLEMFLTFIKNECEAKVCFSTFRELTKRILKRDAQFVEGLPHRVLP
jgi:hypothetical protein